MDFVLLGKALVLGIVEGATEFLLVSSTGHLILAGSLLDFHGDIAKVFDVVIQFGAILAVCWEYRQRIAAVVAGLPSRAKARRVARNVIVACIPASVLGVLLARHIKDLLFAPVPVAFALVAGGMLILWAEALQRDRSGPRACARSTS